MRILIADDHPIVRHGLKQVLANDPAATVVGEATNGDEALDLARKVEWDMAIFDFSMPGRSGLDLLGDLKREFPGRPVLILSMHSEDVHGSRALRGGAAGYITKESAPTELTTAVRKVANGGKYVSSSLAEILASECSSDPQKALHEKLSDREYRVMWLLATGKQISEIAKEMGLSPSHGEHLSHAHPAQAQPDQQRRARALRRAPPAGRMTDMSEAAAAHRAVAAARAPGAAPAAKAKILLVDDEQKSLYALEQLLAPLGDELLTAPSGEEALQARAEARLRGDPARRAHARHRRLRDRADDPRPRALAPHADHLPHRRGRRDDLDVPRLRGRRGRLPDEAGGARGAAVQGRGVRRAAPQERAAAASPRRSCAAWPRTWSRIREEERAHIAREIHDELGQVLTGLKMEVT